MGMMDRDYQHRKWENDRANGYGPLFYGKSKRVNLSGRRELWQVAVIVFFWFSLLVFLFAIFKYGLPL